MSVSVSRRAMTGGRRRALLAAEALVAAGLGLVLTPQLALAQVLIADGQHFIVDPDGPGAGDPSGTHAGPWPRRAG